MENIKLEQPIEYELKEYHEPLFHRTSKNGGIGTHDALISHSAYTLAEMWLDGVKWKEELWGEICDETQKAILVSVYNILWWIPKRLVKKVRKTRQINF